MTESFPLMADRHSRHIEKVEETGESGGGICTRVWGYDTAGRLTLECVGVCCFLTSLSFLTVVSMFVEIACACLGY